VQDVAALMDRFDALEIEPNDGELDNEAREALAVLRENGFLTAGRDHDRSAGVTSESRCV
jgi:hypothetical protein